MAGPLALTPPAVPSAGWLGRARRTLAAKLRWHLRRMPERAVEHGCPPGWLGWRWMAAETLSAHLARRQIVGKTVHPAKVFANPLPRNVGDVQRLATDGALWGYAMRDVPTRHSAATRIATLNDCRLFFYTDPDKGNFYPAIVTDDHRALALREIAFRPRHGAQLRAGLPAQHLRRATWIAERVYHNHSHWLTAHLPKLILLQQHGMLGDVVLPRRRTAVMDASMRMLGIDPDGLTQFDPALPLAVDTLTLIETDRFRPELLRSVRAAFASEMPRAPRRRVFISRADSRGRKLLDEDRLWPRLRTLGFERVLMERLDFGDQVRLMQDTAVLAGPHGAGLTNMIFCPPGAQIVEIADPGFPNPNFYALASALGHDYWLVEGAAVGDAPHPLDRDLIVRSEVLDPVLAAVTA